MAPAGTVAGPAISPNTGCWQMKARHSAASSLRDAASAVRSACGCIWAEVRRLGGNGVVTRRYIDRSSDRRIESSRDIRPRFSDETGNSFVSRSSSPTHLEGCRGVPRSKGPLTACASEAPQDAGVDRPRRRATVAGRCVGVCRSRGLIRRPSGPVLSQTACKPLERGAE